MIVSISRRAPRHTRRGFRSCGQRAARWCDRAPRSAADLRRRRKVGSWHTSDLRRRTALACGARKAVAAADVVTKGDDPIEFLDLTLRGSAGRMRSRTLPLGEIERDTLAGELADGEQPVQRAFEVASIVGNGFGDLRGACREGRIRIMDACRGGQHYTICKRRSSPARPSRRPVRTRAASGPRRQNSQGRAAAGRRTTTCRPASIIGSASARPPACVALPCRNC